MAQVVLHGEPILQCHTFVGDAPLTVGALLCSLSTRNGPFATVDIVEAGTCFRLHFVRVVLAFFCWFYKKNHDIFGQRFMHCSYMRELVTNIHGRILLNEKTWGIVETRRDEWIIVTQFLNIHASVKELVVQKCSHSDPGEPIGSTTIEWLVARGQSHYLLTLESFDSTTPPQYKFAAPEPESSLMMSVRCKCSNMNLYRL